MTVGELKEVLAEQDDNMEIYFGYEPYPMIVSEITTGYYVDDGADVPEIITDSVLVEELKEDGVDTQEVVWLT